MDQRDDGTDAEVQSKFGSKSRTDTDPNVDAHHHRSGDNRHGATETQIFANLRSHRLDPANLILTLAELRGKAFLHLVPQGAEFHRAFVQTNQVFVGAWFAEVLNHPSGQIHFFQYLT